MTTFTHRFRTECVEGSGIHPALYAAAIEIIEDTGFWEPNRALNQKVSTQWQFKPPHGYGAIAAFKQERGGIWQAKPEQPRRDRDGKLIKYESVKGAGAVAWLPPVPVEIRAKISQNYGIEVPTEGSFWEWVAQHPEIPRILTEGGKKAASLLSQGYVAIALLGVDSGATRNESGELELIADLKPLVQPETPITLAFDQDLKFKTRERVANALTRLGGVLQSHGAVVRVASWDGAIGKGIDDLYVAAGAAAVASAIDNAPILAKQYNPLGLIGGFKGALSAFLKKHAPKLQPPKGFAPPAPSPVPIAEYDQGDRVTTWQTLTEGGNAILDTSLMGLGKSFDAGSCQPDDFGARQLFYVSDNHRNPTTEPLLDWEDLEARHSGLSRVPTPNGGVRLQRTPPGESYSVPPNCSRSRIVGVLREKAVNGADTAQLICGTCPLKEACQHAEGRGYGFLNQRRSALASPRLRAHPDSLPSPTEYDYSDVVVLWDEPGQSLKFKQSITVDFDDWEQTYIPLWIREEIYIALNGFLSALFGVWGLDLSLRFKYLCLLILLSRIDSSVFGLLPDSAVFPAIRPLLDTLLGLVDESVPTGRYGLPHNEIVEQLPDCSGLDVDAIAAELKPDLSFLNKTQEYGEDLENLPPSLRKKFVDRDYEISEKAKNRVIKQWLPILIQVLQGSVRGHLHVHRGKLTITIADTRHQAVLQACKGVVLLDGTLDPEDLALMAGIPLEKITVVRQKVEAPANLTIQQVTDLGRLSMQRRDTQQKRVKAIVDQIQKEDPTAKAIDFLKFQDEGMGAWWRDSRGSNDFTECNTLILVGTPCRNLTDLRADFAILTGSHDFESGEFAQFRDRRIRADLHQGVFRLRPHRRQDEQLRVIVLSDFDLGLPNVEQIAASSLTPAAATKFEQFKLAALAAIAQLREAGGKITQTAVSAICGFSQQYLSRHWALLQMLLESSNNKSGKNLGDPPDPEISPVIDAIAAAVDEVATLQNPQILVETLEKEVFAYIPEYLIPAFFERLSDRTWQPLIAALLPIVGAAELEKMIA